ncbi:MAG: hypothetical protein GX288_07485 [Clostridiales bacterium]|nr:hypothetical protein [Clostridiales bacterium]
MKITFWSPYPGQAGTTSNILAVSLITTLLYKKPILLTQTHFNYSNLERPLVGSNLRISETSDYFMDMGLDALIRYFKAAKLNNDIIENCCISLPKTSLRLLPGTCKTNRESFEYEMNNIIVNLFRVMERSGNIIFTDVSSGDNPISLKIINASDLLVINLNQNISLLDNFFNKYNNVPANKVFYLIGNYDKNSKYNINNIRRRYRKYINIHNSGVVPYNTKYLDALCDGNIIEFFLDNLKCTKKDLNWYFINHIKVTSKKIMEITDSAIDMEEGKEISYELSFVE